jgi:hypothetical protein
MKLNHLQLTPFVSIAILALTLPVVLAKDVSNRDKYFCAWKNNIPRTIVRTELGDKIIISWVKNNWSEWKPYQRCLQVSQRFQRFSDNGILQYIATGKQGKYPVLCAVAKSGHQCNSKNILVTLPPDANSQETARKLLDTRNLIKGREVYMSGDQQLESYIEGENYYNFIIIKELAPIEANDIK